MRVLVTGGSGFIGRWAIESLVARGADVHATSRQPRRQKQIAVHACDLLDPADTNRVLDLVRPTAVLHLAWYVEHGKFWAAEENLDWTTATIALLRACRRLGIARFVGAGTCFEYAWPAEGDCDEVATRAEPTTLYAVSKDAVHRLARELDLPSLAWARIFYPFGPFEGRGRLTPSIARNLACGRPAPMSSGRAIRDFMDVRDVGDALAALALSDVRGTVNVSSGCGETIRSLAERLGRISGRGDLIRIGSLQDRPHEPPRIVGACRRLSAEVGFKPKYDLDRGLADAYAWWCEDARAHHEFLPEFLQ